MRPGNREIIHNAWRAGTMVPAFNVPYLPMIEPVIRAVADTDSFAFIATARLEWYKFEAKGLPQVLEEYRRHERPAHIRLHVDHVPVIDEDNVHVDFLADLRQAADLGYDSIMVDGSRLGLDENIAATRDAVAIAHAAGIPCEAELGAVMGHEAGPLPPYDELFASGKGFTDVEEARRFVKESECDWLSVAIGNIHGAISGAMKDVKKPQARLDLDHLAKLKDATGIPLVLHGGTGIPRELVMEAIRRGIAKVNVASEIRQAYEIAMREHGDTQRAREDVYQRTVWLIEEHFELAGSRKVINPDAE
jgi:fructose-bisphosphate aldolase, class II